MQFLLVVTEQMGIADCKYRIHTGQCKYFCNFKFPFVITLFSNKNNCKFVASTKLRKKILHSESFNLLQHSISPIVLSYPDL